MKTAVLIFSLFLSLQFAVGQTPSMKLGPEIPLNKDQAFYISTITRTKEGSLALLTLGRIRYIAELDANGNILTKNAIQFPFHGKEDSGLVSLVYLHDHYLILSSYFDASAKTGYLYGSEIDLKGKAMGEGKLLDQKKIKNKSDWNPDYLKWNLSPDSSKFLVYHYEEMDYGDPLKFTVGVFDIHLQKIWSSMVTMPIKEKDMFASPLRLGDEGSVYIYANPIQEKFRHEFTVYRLNNGSKQDTLHFNTDAETYPLFNDFILDNTGHLYISGFYSRSKSTYPKYAQMLHGVFYTRINTTTYKVESSKTIPFPKEFLDKFKSTIPTSKNELEHMYQILKLVKQPNDNLFLLAQYIDEGGFANGHSYPTIYNTILVISVKPSGELQWVNAIPRKATVSSGPGKFMRQFATASGTSCIVIYDDIHANIDIYDADEAKMYSSGGMFASKNVDVVAAVISSDGTLKKYPLLVNSDDAGYLVVANGSFSVNDNTVEIYLENDHNYRYGRITWQ